jgi:hypothetical protein
MRDSNRNNKDGVGRKQEKSSIRKCPTSAIQLWLGMRFEDRELYKEDPDSVRVEYFKRLLEGQG